MVKAANGQIVKWKGRKAEDRLTQRTRAPEEGGRRKREAGNMDGQDGQDEGGDGSIGARAVAKGW
jgi:hypothetical protein